jgi:hypothetical protein
MEWAMAKCPYCVAELEQPMRPSYVPKVGRMTCAKCGEAVYYLNHLNWDMTGYTGRPALMGRTFPKDKSENEKFGMQASKERIPGGCVIALVSAISAATGLCGLAIMAFGR